MNVERSCSCERQVCAIIASSLAQHVRLFDMAVLCLSVDLRGNSWIYSWAVLVVSSHIVQELERIRCKRLGNGGLLREV